MPIEGGQPSARGRSNSEIRVGGPEDCWHLLQQPGLLAPQFLLSPPALADVAADSGKDMLAIADRFAKGDLQPNLLAALVQPRKLHPFPREVPLPGSDILLDGLLVNLPEIVGHQHRQQLSYQFIL